MDTSVSAVAPVAIRRRHCEIAGDALRQSWWSAVHLSRADGCRQSRGGDPQLIYDPLHGIDERLWTLVLNTVGH